jgi:clan AA aspartic protease
MTRERANGVGRITVEFQVANADDLVRVRDGTLSADKVPRQTIRGVVDSGAAKLVLPQGVVKQLGLPPGNDFHVHYADGRTARRRQAGAARVEILGRHDTFSAIVEPRRQTALIGAMVLEGLDLLVDCQNQRLIPRDPKGPVYEIE